MSGLKKLAGDTLIYGASSIVGRFINWWLVPYYSHMFLPGEYGIVTNLFSYMAFLMVFLTYGMETGYFRFASKAEDKNLVYSSTLVSLFFTSISFLLLALAFSQDIASWMGYPDNPEYIRWIALIMAIDASMSIPFAKLRIENRAVKFATLKFISILVNVGLNVFFLSVCPYLIKDNPSSWVQYVYDANKSGVAYVLISNLVASLVVLLFLVPEMWVRIRFKGKILREMLWYSFPILIVGVASMINQNIDKILLPKLLPDKEQAMQQLGIYGANYKLAVLMNMFIQAFRYAFEPFFFSKTGGEDDKTTYAQVLKYFAIFGCFIFLGVSLFLGVFEALNVIDSSYYSGLKIVPIVLLANLFLGIYYTLSLWYKLADKTRYGAYFAIAGALITLLVNIIYIPTYGYVASAYAVLIASLVMVTLSYSFGQKFYPIQYPILRILFYIAFSLLLYFISKLNTLELPALYYAINMLLFLSFAAVVAFLERNEVKNILMRRRMKK